MIDPNPICRVPFDASFWNQWNAVLRPYSTPLWDEIAFRAWPADDVLWRISPLQ
jgi:hypothetical protein